MFSPQPPLPNIGEETPRLLREQPVDVRYRPVNKTASEPRSELSLDYLPLPRVSAHTTPRRPRPPPANRLC